MELQRPSLAACLTWSERPAAAQPSSGMSNARTLAAVSKPLALGAGPVTAVLGSTGKRSDTLAAAVESASKGQRLHVVLKDLKVEQQPGVVYRLYLNVRPESVGSDLESHRVGTLNFFNAVNVPAGDSRGVRSFDVTELVQRLVREQTLKGPLTLTIVPAGAPEAKPVIGRVELVARQ